MEINNNDLVFIGDLHGHWEEINHFVNKYNVENLNFVQVGDFGLGYLKKNKQDSELKELSDFLKERGCFLYVIRGNHDDPYYFDGNYNFENIFFLKDYTVLSNEKHSILCIGGATSIDRLYSQESSERIGRPLWWKDEIFIYDEGKINEIIKNYEIDTIVTHNSPNSFYPYSFGRIVYEYSINDHMLIQDLTNERILINKIYEKFLDNILPKNWIYGHFHKSHVEDHNGLFSRLLNINEFYYLK